MSNMNDGVTCISCGRMQEFVSKDSWLFGAPPLQLASAQVQVINMKCYTMHAARLYPIFLF